MIKLHLITNNTPLRTTGNKNYGIYASGEITNLADMDFSAGIGNVGILNVRDIGSTTSKAVNGQLGAASQPTITVGKVMLLMKITLLECCRLFR